MKQFVLPFEPKAGQSEYTLGGKSHHYLIRVRRCRSGQTVRARSPGGDLYEMTFVKTDAHECLVSLRLLSRPPDDLPVRITLAAAVIKRMDLTIRQAVEAGASVIFPLLTDHTQIRFRQNSGHKMDRWHRIISETFQQCGGPVTPVLEDPQTPVDFLTAWNRRGPLFFLHERTDSGESLHRHLAAPVSETAIMVGPEGGFSPQETAQFLDFGALPVYLGSRILRAETASVYGLAAVCTIIRERAKWHSA